MPAQAVIQLRRGTAAQWTSANPTLAAGEIGLETDTDKLKIGNGTIAWNSLAYSSGIQGVQGTFGPQGIQGSSGAQGAQGLQGRQGTLGLQGIQGAQGIQGRQGTTGIQGNLGTQGTTGAGTQGVQGAQGTQGLLGNQGTTGAGTQGTQGVQGNLGIQGSIGSGTQGTTGTQGASGLQGTQGIQGIFGPATIVQNPQTSAYVLVASDNGKYIDITTGGITLNTGIFTVGQNVVIYNNSALSQTITQGSGVTLRLASTASTGNRTLAQYGVATILCVGTNTYVVAGTGIA
jgi:hypothetical protein